MYDFCIVVAPPPTYIHFGEEAWPLCVGIGIVDAFPPAYLGVRRRARLCENGYCVYTSTRIYWGEEAGTLE